MLGRVWPKGYYDERLILVPTSQHLESTETPKDFLWGIFVIGSFEVGRPTLNPGHTFCCLPTAVGSFCLFSAGPHSPGKFTYPAPQAFLVLEPTSSGLPRRLKTGSSFGLLWYASTRLGLLKHPISHVGLSFKRQTLLGTQIIACKPL